MARDEDYDPRGELLELLFDRLRETTYPSATQLDLIEESVTTREHVETYARLLLEKISSETFPSNALVRRVIACG